MARNAIQRTDPIGGLMVQPGDAATVITPSAFTSLAWWDKINAEEQQAVLSAGTRLAQALLVNGASRLAIGEHLTTLQGTLEPHNLFGRFLKNFHFSKRSAYRRIAEFKNAKGNLPEAVLKAAMARGVTIAGDSDQKPLGIYTEAVKKLPPPTAPDMLQANTWLDQIEQVRKDVRTEAADAANGNGGNVTLQPMDVNDAQKECFRLIENRFNRVPQRQRQKFLQGLQGMLLTLSGVSNPLSISPQAIPDDFRVHRGRPATKVAAA
jgi:hypothetical protein